MVPLSPGGAGQFGSTVSWVPTVLVAGHRTSAGQWSLVPSWLVHLRPQHRRLICFQVRRGTSCVASGSLATTGSS